MILCAVVAGTAESVLSYQAVWQYYVAVFYSAAMYWQEAVGDCFLPQCASRWRDLSFPACQSPTWPE